MGIHGILIKLLELLEEGLIASDEPAFEQRCFDCDVFL